MNEPEVNNPPRARIHRSLRYGVLAAILGTVAGFGAVYWTGGLPRNASAPVDAACINAGLTAKRLMPLAKGEVAAMAVNSSPRRAIDLAFKDAAGQTVTLESLRGKVVLVNLWATWCVPCRKEMPALDALQRELGGADFAVIAINLDTQGREKPRSFLESINVRNLVYYDDPTTTVFQKLKMAGRAPGLPTSLLIDRDGCELGFVPGPAEWASEDAFALIRAAIARN